MQHSNFVHLHLHTQYSLLDGAIRLEELFTMARDYRMPAVAMTDHGNMFGAIEFYRQATRYGLKPIIGCEVYVAPGSRFERTAGGIQEASYHLILLVKDNKGYRNLCKLVTAGYLEGFYYRPRIDKEILFSHNEGLIALSACLHGEIPCLLSNGDREKARKVAAEFKEVFDDKRFFLELQHNGIPEQKKVNEGLLELARAMDIPLVATNDCHYIRKEEARSHDILLCIQTGKTVNTSDRLRFQTDEFYFKSPQEMEQAFHGYPDTIRNTIEIAERCNLDIRFGEYHLPHFPIPEGETLVSYLEKEAKKGLEERLKTTEEGAVDMERVRGIYYERLEKELQVITATGFSGYFLIVADFINYARQNHIPVGPGRGSAAGSLVAYALKITNLDPVRYGLLFERFLNPDRVSPPDIDIDFCFEGRDDVIRYVAERYGKENVTQIITFGQMKARAAIRDVGRAMDMPYGDVDRIAKLVPNTPNITIDEALRQEPRLEEMVKKDPRVKGLVDIARALEGLPRHASTHAAGIVISNRPLIDYLPLYKGQKEDVITTQYAMNDVAAIGLVKFDILGLKTLTVIDKTIRLVENDRGEGIDIERIPLDDKDTYKLIGTGATNGIFQLEGSGMKEILVKMRPETFEDIMAAVALYRPGPLQSGMVEDFIKRKHGKVAIQYEVPQLREILENTYGVIVYQEQVMEIAKQLAGFSPGDADHLRRAMGKKLPEEMAEQRERFLEGAKRNKIPKQKAERLFNLMANFAGYGFNKSHSAAYALIAYQTAYLKAHYPVEFMAALLTSDMGDTDKVIRYIGECREMGIEVLPPNVNESYMDFTVIGGSIRFGLAAVKNVGGAAIEAILDARARGGQFTTLLDFCQRVDMRKVNKRVIESLIKCGAFDFTDMKRAQLMVSLDKVMDMAQGMRKDRETGQMGLSLFTVHGSRFTVSHELADVEEWPEAQLLAYEKEALGFYITGHPLASFLEELKLYADVDTETVKDRRDGEVVGIGGVIITVKEKTTKRGERMAFLTLEDLKGSIEVMVFADLLKRSSPYITGDTPIFVKGRVDRMEDKVKIVAEDIYPISEAKQRLARAVHIKINTLAMEGGLLEDVKGLLKTYPGGCPVMIHLLYPEGREVVIALPEDLKVIPTKEMCKAVKGLLGPQSIHLA